MSRDFFGRMFRNNANDLLASSDDEFAVEFGDWCPEGPGATLVTSRLAEGFAFPSLDALHAPVIDIDLPCHWEPSTAPGHGHLYINHAMPWADVVKLLDVLVEVGIVQAGFRDASVKRKYTACRTPWTKKPAKGGV